MNDNAPDDHNYTVDKPTVSDIGHIGHPRASLMEVFNVHETMSLTESESTGGRRIQRSDTIDLHQYSDVYPEGTMIDMAFRGTPGSFTVELERNGDRFIVEGCASSAELTSVFGAGDPDKPRRVPDWIGLVLEDECGVREVSVY